MPPPCHRANTPGACGAAAINDSVNGTLPLLIDMLPPRLHRNAFYACSSVVDANSVHLSPRFDSAKTKNVFSRLPQCGDWHGGCRTPVIKKPGGKRGNHAVEAEWRFVPGTRADHRGCAERAHPAVRVRCRAAAPRNRGK